MREHDDDEEINGAIEEEDVDDKAPVPKPVNKPRAAQEKKNKKETTAKRTTKAKKDAPAAAAKTAEKKAATSRTRAAVAASKKRRVAVSGHVTIAMPFLLTCGIGCDGDAGSQGASVGSHVVDVDFAPDGCTRDSTRAARKAFWL